MSTETRPPLPTTGRVTSRVRGEVAEKLQQRLATYAFNPAEVPQLGENRHVELEIGFGNGGALVHRAQLAPQTLHIGAELFLDGLKSCVHQLETQDITAKIVRLWPQDARVLLEQLPADSIDRLLVLHPDPWPKTRHHKRRLVQKEFLDHAQRVLKPEGELLMVTDWADYAHWMLAHTISHCGFVLQSNNPADLATPPADWTKTKYQNKAEQESRHNWYLRFGVQK